MNPKGVKENLTPFTSDKQPPPEAKSEGWRKRRAEKLLTQKIIEVMTKGRNLDEYVKSLVDNAKLGNSKAIETINKGLEEEVIKIANTDTDGNPSLSGQQFNEILNAARNNASTSSPG